MKLGSRRSRCCVLACTIALAVGTPSRALADEQVFVLKNGRKIQGELDGEDATSYTIRTTGGKTVVPKSLVSRIDAVQEQPKGPAGPKPAPDAGKPGGGPSEKGDPGGKAPGAAEAPKPNAPEDEPAANPEPVTPGDMTKARKAI